MQGYAMFSVVEKASGLWIGQAGPWQPEGWPGTEVGWAFHRSSWGKGYATEAATAAIDWSFANLGWRENALTNTRLVPFLDNLLEVHQFSRIPVFDEKRTPGLAFDGPSEHLPHFGQHSLGRPPSAPCAADSAQHMQ